MYKRGISEGLSGAELEAARLGFNQLLRRRRFSPQWIAREGEEAFATAALEYARKLAEGERIENPPGWIIECAWLRAKNRLEAGEHGPRAVSTERSGPLADEHGKDPLDTLLGAERFGRVRSAVAELSPDRRRLLALSYFEGFTVREAARRLGWHPSKAQRAHEGARRQLHELLGVKSSDELELVVGLASYLSLAAGGGWRLRALAWLEGAGEAASHAATQLWGRTQELARRFAPWGGAEPAGAALGSGAGRAAGACAAAALACLASGVVGPGVDGLVGGGHAKPQRVAAQHATPARALSATAPSAPAPRPEPLTQSGGGHRQPRQSAATARASRQRRATEAAREQFGIESAAGRAEYSAPSGSGSGAEASSTGSSGGSGSGGSGGSRPSPDQIANEAFGLH
jgi:RNA polymerase sigma factor (sigma-70 family)